MVAGGVPNPFRRVPRGGPKKGVMRVYSPSGLVQTSGNLFAIGVSVENLTPKETPAHETAVERLMLWGNWCLIVAFTAMTVRGMVQWGRGDLRAGVITFLLAVGLGLMVPPLDAIRLTMARMRKLRELSRQAKLLAAELESLRRLAEKKEGGGDGAGL